MRAEGEIAEVFALRDGDVLEIHEKEPATQPWIAVRGVPVDFPTDEPVSLYNHSADIPVGRYALIAA